MTRITALRWPDRAFLHLRSRRPPTRKPAVAENCVRAALGAAERQKLGRISGHNILSSPKEAASSKAGKTGMSEDAKLGLVVLFMVLAIMMIGPVLAG